MSKTNRMEKNEKKQQASQKQIDFFSLLIKIAI